jgi:hypothetical protein
LHHPEKIQGYGYRTHLDSEKEYHLVEEMPGRKKPYESKDNLKVTVPEKSGQGKESGYKNGIMNHRDCKHGRKLIRINKKMGKHGDQASCSVLSPEIEIVRDIKVLSHENIDGHIGIQQREIDLGEVVKGKNNQENKEQIINECGYTGSVHKVALEVN